MTKIALLIEAAEITPGDRVLVGGAGSDMYKLNASIEAVLAF